ncbi:unnamed protein product [Allacma fusca]|uniref:LRRNT domain-containing protein n=1 Tax=Allacma fusca TaxID=39272 RepID=A0A8J2NV90_9HEXA|nr:unnamed protein product [Allacma fusca]
MSLWSNWDSFITPLGVSRADGSGLSRLHVADRMFKNTQRISMVLLVAVLVFVTSSGLNNDVLGICPKDCQCYNLQVDCSHRGLHSVPKGIPRNVEKIELQGNNLTTIRLSDFAGLGSLRVIQLSDNEIHTVEKGSFQDLASLERLLPAHRLRTTRALPLLSIELSGIQERCGDTSFQILRMFFHGYVESWARLVSLDDRLSGD